MIYFDLFNFFTKIKDIREISLTKEIKVRFYHLKVICIARANGKYNGKLIVVTNKDS